MNKITWVLLAVVQISWGMELGLTTNATEVESDRTRRDCCGITCESNCNKCCISSCCWESFDGIKPFEFCRRHYYLHADPLSFYDAYFFCTNHGMKLMKVDICNSAYMDFIEYLSEQGVPKFWIGLTDLKNEGEYVWLQDGTAAGPLLGWAPEEPKSDDDAQDCTLAQVEICDRPIGSWQSAICDELHPFVCVVPDSCYTACQCR